MHVGTLANHYMMNLPYNLKYIDESNVTFTCEIHENGVKMFVDGVHIFTSQETILEGDYFVMFDALGQTHLKPNGFEEDS